MRTFSRPWVIVTGLAILIVAFAPRAFSLDRALTIDEALWIDRSDRFVSHVSQAQFSQAFETGHPGVTIMWIGGLAQRTLPDDTPLRDRYARARLALAVVDVALILAIAWMLASIAGGLAGFHRLADRIRARDRAASPNLPALPSR